MLRAPQITTIQPGIYDISNEAYHSGGGISRSGIMEFKTSPLHYWDRYLNPDRERGESTVALEFGNALHTFVLEPNEFFKRYAVAPKVDKRTTAGKTAWQIFENENAGKELITEVILKELENMAAVLFAHPEIKELITGAKYEKSIYWRDNDTGLLLKCRPDIWHSFAICDLKTTADASQYAFEKSVYQYGYHIQAAMMQDAIQALEGKWLDDFIFIPIEKKRPYATTYYPLDPMAIEEGRKEYKKQLVGMKECMERNSWPGYQSKIISLPRYAFYQG